MSLKAPTITLIRAITTLGTSGDTSIQDTDLQLVTIGQLQEIVNRLIDNNQILKEQINRVDIAKIKLLSIKRFLGKKLKLKEFLIQIHFKVIQEGLKLAITLD